MEKRRRWSAAAWGGWLARFAQSGLTVRAFCANEAISTASFYRWRARLGSSPDRPQPSHTAPSVANTASGFIDLGALRTGNTRLELRLDLGGGVLLHLVRE